MTEPQDALWAELQEFKARVDNLEKWVTARIEYDMDRVDNLEKWVTARIEYDLRGTARPQRS